MPRNSCRIDGARQQSKFGANPRHGDERCLLPSPYHWRNSKETLLYCKDAEGGGRPHGNTLCKLASRSSCSDSAETASVSSTQLTLAWCSSFLIVSRRRWLRCISTALVSLSLNQLLRLLYSRYMCTHTYTQTSRCA